MKIKTVATLIAALALPGALPASAGPAMAHDTTTADDAAISAAIDSTWADIVTEVENSNRAAFIANKAPTAPTLSASAAPRAADGLVAESTTAMKMARAMRSGESPRHVGSVVAQRSGKPTITTSTSGTVARVDVRITRHVIEDDVDWEEVVPHVITLSPAAQVTSITAEDDEYRS